MFSDLSKPDFLSSRLGGWLSEIAPEEICTPYPSSASVNTYSSLPDK